MNTLIFSFIEHFNETRVRSTLPAQKDTLLNILISFELEAYEPVHVVFHRCYGLVLRGRGVIVYAGICKDYYGLDERETYLSRRD